MRETPQITGMPKEGSEPAVESTIVISKNVQRLIEHFLAKQPRRSGSQGEVGWLIFQSFSPNPKVNIQPLCEPNIILA